MATLSLTTLIKICYSKNLEQKVWNIKFYHKTVPYLNQEEVFHL